MLNRATARALMLAAPTYLAMSVADLSAQTPAFDYLMPSRFGDRVDGKVNYHWDPGAMRYDPAWVSPSKWPVQLTACATVGAQNGATYMWTFGDGSPPETKASCATMHDFPKLGTYAVSLAVQNPGAQPVAITHNIDVRDWLIVSLGDSYASGQGSPDIPQVWDAAHAFPIVGPKWEDKRCARSATAGPAQAALAIEQRDPHSSVTFLSFACSGAMIGMGLLGPYDGADITGLPASHALIPPQVDQLVHALCPGADVTCIGSSGSRQTRKIDALIVSIGGNDIGFADIVERCAETDLAARNVNNIPGVKAWYCYQYPDLRQNFDASLQRLRVNDRNSGGYDLLAGSLAGRGLQVSQVYLSEYPDPSHAKDGMYCGVGDRPSMLDVPKWGRTIEAASTEWAHDNALAPLNNAGREAAAKYHWGYAGGVASQFATHGMCAEDQRWYRSYQDAVDLEGTFNMQTMAVLPWITSGVFHPNELGHAAYAQALLKVLPMAKPRQLRVTFALGANGEAGTPTTLTLHVLDERGQAIAAKARMYGETESFDSDVPHPVTLHARPVAVWVSAPEYNDAVAMVAAPPKRLSVTVDPFPVKLNRLGAARAFAARTGKAQLGDTIETTDVTVRVTDKTGKPVAGVVTIENCGQDARDPADREYRTNTPIKGYPFRAIVLRVRGSVYSCGPRGRVTIPNDPDFEQKEFYFSEIENESVAPDRVEVVDVDVAPPGKRLPAGGKAPVKAPSGTP